MKCKENEQLTKEVAELKDSSRASPYGSTKDAEIKKLQEEITRLKSLNKHRDDIINQIESQNKNLRDTETQLKLTQNDYELL